MEANNNRDTVDSKDMDKANKASEVSNKDMDSLSRAMVNNREARKVKVMDSNLSKDMANNRSKDTVSLHSKVEWEVSLIHIKVRI